MKLDKIIFDVETKKPISIELDDIVKGRALFQANSGGGKSYLLRKFLEESNGKIQQIIIDPEGEFSTLREKYDYLLVGKDNADIQIDINYAELLAKRLLETDVDAILDLYEMSTFERIRFVKVFVNALVNLPKKLWHPCLVVIDEIHVFAPESSKGRSESLEAVASLASRGRKRGYALIGATQKLSKFHKDVASELNTKFTGRCTLDIDQKRAAQELGMKKHTDLRNIKHEFYVFGPGINKTIKVKCYPVKTTHEEIGSTAQVKLANPTKIKSMMLDFNELPQEAKNELKTTQDLNKKISEQSMQIRTLERQQPKIDPKQLENAEKRGFEKGFKSAKERITRLESVIKWKLKRFNTIVTILGTLRDNSQEIIDEFEKELDVKIELPEKLELKLPIFDKEEATIKQTITQNVDTDTTLGRCEKAILETLAKFQKPCSKVKIGIFAGYSSKSGGFSNAISKLKNAGYVTANNGDLEITQSGAEQVVFVKPLPDTNDEILTFWINKVGRCSGEILKVVVPVYPNSISKEDVATQANYSANSGGFSNAISKLRTLGLIDYSNGQLKATEDMFP